MSSEALVEVERRFEEWSGDFKVTMNEWGTAPSMPQRLVMVSPALALAIRKETSIYRSSTREKCVGAVWLYRVR